MINMVFQDINNYIGKNFFGAKYSRILSFRKKNVKNSRFVSGSNYKFSKFHKIIDKNICNKVSYPHSLYSNSSFSLGLDFQIIIKSPRFGYLNDFQIKSFRNLLKKPYKNLLSTNFYPYLGVTKKPAEVRMGKGKGSKISHRVFLFRAGRLIGSVSRRFNMPISDFRLSNKLKFYSAKFPFKLGIIKGSF